MKFKAVFLVLATVYISVPFQLRAENAISVSQIQGLENGNGLMTNTTIRYFMNYEVESAELDGFANPLEISSPDGATWQAPTTMPLIMLNNYYDLFATFYNYGGGGSGADTIDLYCVRISAPGFPQGFNQDVYYIQTRLTDDNIGKTLCLDSVWTQFTGWLWAAGLGAIPSWDGPHCYSIVDCCAGSRGDVNGDGAGPNILDLTRLVDYLFRGVGAPDCRLEADVNSDGMPYNILDLTFIVNRMHRGGPAPGPCP